MNWIRCVDGRAHRKDPRRKGFLCRALVKMTDLPVVSSTDQRRHVKILVPYCKACKKINVERRRNWSDSGVFADATRKHES
jgi:hypothetical protein